MGGTVCLICWILFVTTNYVDDATRGSLAALLSEEPRKVGHRIRKSQVTASHHVELARGLGVIQLQLCDHTVAEDVLSSTSLRRTPTKNCSAGV